MKPLAEMNLAELAAYVQTFLRKAGIQAVLSGGGAVSFYSSYQYVSNDIDLINDGLMSQNQIKKVMLQLGFERQTRYFKHSESEILVEFPAGPLSVGDELVRDIQQYSLETGILSVLSATDCVKDRLCAFYYWKDYQGLTQAVLVARAQKVDLSEIKRWSIAEGKLSQFEEFEKMLN